MYAVIEACGKQYKVEEKDVVFFEKLDAEEGKKVTFDKVILVSAASIVPFLCVITKNCVVCVNFFRYSANL